jgi:hypothetical protein
LAYFFSSQVRDDPTGVYQTRKEEQNSKELRGEYQVLDPDGYLRIVTYWDTGSGFNVNVERRRLRDYVNAGQSSDEDQGRPRARRYRHVALGEDELQDTQAAASLDENVIVQKEISATDARIHEQLPNDQGMEDTSSQTHNRGANTDSNI